MSKPKRSTVTVRNDRRVTVEAGGHLFPPRRSTTIEADAEQLAAIRARGLEAVEQKAEAPPKPAATATKEA